MKVSVPASEVEQSATITLTGTTATSLVTDILSANLPNIVADIEASGAVSISHLAGGTIEFTYATGTPLTTAGLLTDNNMRTILAGSVYLASPFAALTYTYSETSPYSNPNTGTYWYYNSPLDVDIMINDGAGWKGYQNVANDARGFDLTDCDPEGAILSVTEPIYQADGTTPVVDGDLWISTSAADLANYPVIYRYDGTIWELIDNKDQITTDGILFADARYGKAGATGDTAATIEDLISSDYIDPDAPDPDLYPRGMLLWNTRRSGNNVKIFRTTHININENNGRNKRFQGTGIAYDGGTDEAMASYKVNRWVGYNTTAEDGSGLFGRKAQRKVVVRAMQSQLVANQEILNETNRFNICSTPGYAECLDEMLALSVNRKDTVFCVADAPMRLSADATSTQNWATNVGNATENGEDGLISASSQAAVYYPHGLSTNLDGTTVMVPASHMALRTIAFNDSVAFPWFAPAGFQRGVVNNATSTGYLDATTGEFQAVSLSEGQRDSLYLNKINPIGNFPGRGIAVFGQKTLNPSSSALDRINVARLINYIRYQLDIGVKPFLFEPNDSITRQGVKRVADNLLSELVSLRGVFDFITVCDETNNTTARINRNELYLDVAIQPTKAVEFIYIPLRLKNTGEISGL